MKKIQAEKARVIIEAELHKLCDQQDKTYADLLGRGHDMDRMFKVKIIESDAEKGHFGVQVCTDGEVYDLFYAFSDSADINQEKIAKIVNKKLELDSYFEHYGQGILWFF